MSVKVDTIIQCPSCGEEWTNSNYVYSCDYDKLEAQCKELQESNRTLKAQLEKCKEQRNDYVGTGITRFRSEVIDDLDEELDSIE